MDIAVLHLLYISKDTVDKALLFSTSGIKARFSNLNTVFFLQMKTKNQKD